MKKAVNVLLLFYNVVRKGELENFNQFDIKNQFFTC